jgi:hypothetical protein
VFALKEEEERKKSYYIPIAAPQKIIKPPIRHPYIPLLTQKVTESKFIFFNKKIFIVQSLCNFALLFKT